MTLIEADNLKKSDPERYYRLILFIQERLKMEREELEKLGGDVSGSGETDTFTLTEKIPDDIPMDHVSEIGEMKD